MAKDTENFHYYADTDYGVWTGPAGTPLPTDPDDELDPALEEVGLVDQDGNVREGYSDQSQQKRDMANRLIRELLTDVQRPISFTALEENPVTNDLRYYDPVVDIGSGTPQVTRVTITGTGTAGSYVLHYNGDSASVLYSANAAAWTTALHTLAGLEGATTSGTGPFDITTPSSAGLVGLTIDSSGVTGATAAITVTTPGKKPTRTTHVGGGGPKRRVFLFNLSDGDRRLLIGVRNGACKQTGEVAYGGTAGTQIPFQVTPYADSNGDYFVRIERD